jgi:hypothetical protein
MTRRKDSEKSTKRKMSEMILEMGAGFVGLEVPEGTSSRDAPQSPRRSASPFPSNPHHPRARVAASSCQDVHGGLGVSYPE